MLDLQARVHFQKIKLIRIDHEFDGPGAHIIDRPCGNARECRHARAPFRSDRARRRFLHDLLVATLQGAVALQQRHHVAVDIAEHLHLDMTWLGNELLEQHGVISERCSRLALGAGHGLRKLLRALDDAHPSPPAARGGLDQQRITDALGGRLQGGEALLVAVISRHDRNAARFHQRLGRGLRSHAADRVGRRADEDQSGIGAGLRELRILGKKAIAGMYRFGAARACRVDDRIDAQVAVLGRRWPDQHRLVGQRHVQGGAIGIGVYCDGAQPHALGRADDPTGDLPAVGDQQLLEAPRDRHHHILKMPKRVGSGGGALRPAASASANTVRVSAGSMMPSSQRRAVA